MPFDLLRAQKAANSLETMPTTRTIYKYIYVSTRVRVELGKQCSGDSGDVNIYIYMREWQRFWQFRLASSNPSIPPRQIQLMGLNWRGSIGARGTFDSVPLRCGGILDRPRSGVEFRVYTVLTRFFLSRHRRRWQRRCVCACACACDVDNLIFRVRTKLASSYARKEKKKTEKRRCAKIISDLFREFIESCVYAKLLQPYESECSRRNIHFSVWIRNPPGVNHFSTPLVHPSSRRVGFFSLFQQRPRWQNNPRAR